MDHNRNLGLHNRFFEAQARDWCFWEGVMAEAPSLKIKKEDGSPMELLWKYFDTVHNSVHNSILR